MPSERQPHYLSIISVKLCLVFTNCLYNNNVHLYNCEGDWRHVNNADTLFYSGSRIHVSLKEKPWVASVRSSFPPSCHIANKWQKGRSNELLAALIHFLPGMYMLSYSYMLFTSLASSESPLWNGILRLTYRKQHITGKQPVRTKSHAKNLMKAWFMMTSWRVYNSTRYIIRLLLRKRSTHKQNADCRRYAAYQSSNVPYPTIMLRISVRESNLTSFSKLASPFCSRYNTHTNDRRYAQTVWNHSSCMRLRKRLPSNAKYNLGNSLFLVQFSLIFLMWKVV